MNSNFWNTCRVCLQSSDENRRFLSIFQQDGNDDIKIYMKIMDCGGIYINENESFTNLICCDCKEDLIVAQKFRNNCQNSDRKLRENIKLEIQTEIKDEISNFFEEIKTNISSSTSKKTNSCHEEIEDDCKSKSKTKILKSLKPEKNIKKTKRNKNNQLEEKINIKEHRHHKIKTNEKFPCEYCGQSYSDKTTLRYHMRRHTNEMDYVCELCGTAFETNYKLVRHKMTHTGEKPYPCRFCNRPFLHSSNRNLHEKRLHTHIRNHQCEYCVKAFHTPCQLRKHIRVHTGEKPYICDLCLTGFKAKSHLTAHKNSLVPCIIKMKNKVQSEKTKEG